MGRTGRKRKRARSEARARLGEQLALLADVLGHRLDARALGDIGARVPHKLCQQQEAELDAVEACGQGWWGVWVEWRVGGVAVG